MIHRRRAGLTRAVAVATLFGALGCDSVLGPGGDYPLVPDAGDEHLAAAQRLAYEEDAVRLALRHLEATGSAAIADVNPPAGLVASLYNALVRVESSSHPARDTVTEVYGIHTFPSPATREVMVRVDPAYEWTAAWKELRAVTGNPAVDRLVADHALGVANYYEWSIGDVAVLRSASPLNAAALAARFEPVEGVVWAEPNGAGGDGNDIRARPHADGWRLDYSIGFGDCPAGCIGRRTWSFAVAGNGAVRFLGAWE